MRRFNRTRKTILLTCVGSLVVAAAVMLLAVNLMGLTTVGQLFGTASVDRGRDSIGPYFNLESGFGGMQTGFITLKNSTKGKINLKSYKLDEDLSYRIWGWDNLKPGEQIKYDFRGSWHLYFFNGEPTIIDCETRGGGGFERGLRMGPNTANMTPKLGSDVHGNYMEIISGGLGGTATGVIGLLNDSDQPVRLESCYQDGNNWKKWGEDTLSPGQEECYDFKGTWRIYYFGTLPIVDFYKDSGGGYGEWGLKMGPNGGR